MSRRVTLTELADLLVNSSPEDRHEMAKRGFVWLTAEIAAAKYYDQQLITVQLWLDGVLVGMALSSGDM